MHIKKLKNKFKKAYRAGKLNTITGLIKQGLDINTKFYNGPTALHLACKLQNPKMVKYLVKRGANISAEDKMKHTPLHMAFTYYDETIIKYLIKKGADVNAKDFLGLTVLHYICCADDQEFDDITTMRLEMAKYLIEHGADVNIQDNSGYTALHKVKSDFDKELFEYLIGHGANVNAQTLSGDTVLHHICMGKYLYLYDGFAKYLIDNGADVNIKNKKGETTLYLAYLQLKDNPDIDFENQSNNNFIIEYLLDHKATFGDEIDNIYNLFHRSMEDIREEVIKYIEDDNRSYFPFSNPEVFNNILLFENIPEKYLIFRSPEFKVMMYADIINQLHPDSAVYKEKLLFRSKYPDEDVKHIKDKVTDNNNLLKRIKFIED